MTAYDLIQSRETLDSLLDASKSHPVVVFKHSLTCPVSSAALREYERFLEQRADDDGVTYALIEIQKHRDLSKEVAQRSGVRHESPQALLFQGGDVTWNASHWSITADALSAAVPQGVTE